MSQETQKPKQQTPTKTHAIKISHQIFIKHLILEVNMHVLTVTVLFCRSFPIVVQHTYFLQTGNPTAKIQLNCSSKVWERKPFRITS